MVQPYSFIASVAQTRIEDLIAYTPPGKLAIEAVGAVAALTISFFPLHHRGLDTAIAAIVLCLAAALVAAW